MELTEVQKEADSASRKALVFGAFGLLVACFFGYALARLVSGGPETQPVVVAAQDVSPLSTLRLENLKVVQWPTQSIPSGTFAKVEDVIKTGQMNVNGLKPGEPVLADRLSSADRGLGMSQMVEPNMRAFVVQVDEEVATSEILHPGAFVDVVTTLEDPKTRNSVSKIILQNTQILGVGDSVEVERAQAQGDEGQGQDRIRRHRVVTLAIKAGEVEMLTLASRSGRMNLILRNNNDNATIVTTGVTFDRLIGRTTNPPPPPAVGASGTPPPAAGAEPDEGAHHVSRSARAHRRQTAPAAAPAAVRIN